MRSLKILFACVLFIGTLAQGQMIPDQEPAFLSLQSINAQGTFMLGLNKKTGIDRVSGFGGGAEVRFSLDEMFFVGVGGSYGKIGIEEQDPITKWDWGYWNRLYRNYIVLWLGSDSAYYGGQMVSLRAISNTRLTSGKYVGKDSIYAMELKPRQYMNSFPITVSVGARYRVFDLVDLEGIATATVMPFERNFYLEETWTKRRKVDAGPDSGSYYYFSYGYNNYANPHRGTAFGLGATINASVDLSSMFSFYATAHYTQFTATIRKESFEALPMESLVFLGAGIRIRY